MPSKKQSTQLLSALELRCSVVGKHFPGLTWGRILERLEARPKALQSLEAMESTGGEPMVLRYSKKTGEIWFCDFSAESPVGRRSLCFDASALKERKEHQPKGAAVETAKSMGARLLTEDEYRELQSFGEFDTKTSSWLETPSEIRKLGGALFGDRRFGRVFTYHNGAQSYYAARGFRVILNV